PSAPGRTTRVEPESLPAVLADQDRLTPVAVLEIPGDRGAQTLRKSVRGTPAELRLEACGIDGVATVVARPVGNEGPKVRVARDTLPGQRRVADRGQDRLEHLTEAIDDLEIGPLLSGSNVVSAPGDTVTQDQEQRRAMVLDMQPVTHVA